MHDLVIRNGTVVDGTGRGRFEGDIAVDDGRISAIGQVAGSGRRELDARGLMVSPGWVDIHTHYDGQVTWDPLLSPSSWHGVTTCVMGNCGVGFAPVRPGAHDFLIELMEGVEDIPGTALHEGIKWEWQSFPEYLDALSKRSYALDVAAQVPHAAVRAYVLGDRAHDPDITDGEIGQIAEIVQEGLEAGAVGFSTSRTIIHRSVHGLVPGTLSGEAELLAIGQAMRRAGHGVFEMVSDGISLGDPAEFDWFAKFCENGGPSVTFAVAQEGRDPKRYRELFKMAEDLQSRGAHIYPQVACRPPGLLYGLRSSLHPFITHDAFREIAHLPLDQMVARLRDPIVRQRMIDGEHHATTDVGRALITNWSHIFVLGDPPVYEPPAEESATAVAAREGKKPAEVVLDWMLQRDGKQFLFMPIANYPEYNFDATREMILHPQALLGGSDGGAHCGLICDVSMPSYLLAYWVRDRSRGAKLQLETAVQLQTGNTAKAYGLADRGTLEVGKKADINVIDLDRLYIHAPEMIHDLPAGGRRIVQHVDGYRYTICAGEVTMVDGEHTGALPGRLVRGRRNDR
jgi:N-acyl-D-aspartate/D-glutamate deacylase